MSTILSHNPEAITQIDIPPPSNTRDSDPISPLARRKQKFNTRWKQQTLLALRQHLTFLHIMIYYVICGIVCIGLGVYCYISAKNYPKPVVKDYTDCEDMSTPTPKKCSELMANRALKKDALCICEVKIYIDNDNLVKADKVIFYYQLTNFFQNVRNYKKDVDENQLNGKPIMKGGKPVEPNCKYEHYKKPGPGLYTFPCGKVANSYFSDVFVKMVYTTKSNPQPKLILKGIAWKSDKEERFKRPEGLKNWADILNLVNFTLPIDWHDEQKSDFLRENGTEHEHFIVWMRTAATKDFRKKYAYIQNLQKGNYTIEVAYRFDAKSYGGRKRIVIAADAQDKPVDYFFFYMYITSGVICLLAGPLMYLAEYIAKIAHKRRVREMMNQAMEEQNINPTPVSEPPPPKLLEVKPEPPLRLKVVPSKQSQSSTRSRTKLHSNA